MKINSPLIVSLLIVQLLVTIVSQVDLRQKMGETETHLKMSVIQNGFQNSMDSEKIRRLGGTLVAKQTGSVMYFRAMTNPGPGGGERVPVPIVSMTNVMTAILQTTKRMGPNYVPLAVTPEYGFYDGEWALMGAIVTLNAP